MRAPIIEDTTITLTPVLNPFGDEPEVSGWYVGEICPVKGRDILPFPARATRAEAQADIDAVMG